MRNSWPAIAPAKERFQRITGLAILRALVAGQRGPRRLAKLRGDRPPCPLNNKTKVVFSDAGRSFCAAGAPMPLMESLVIGLRLFRTRGLGR